MDNPVGCKRTKEEGRGRKKKNGEREKKWMEEERPSVIRQKKMRQQKTKERIHDTYMY